MNIEGALQQVGLSKQESRVYLALLENRSAQTGRLCEIARVERSNIYKVLSSLSSKGLVSYRIQNNIKVFMASPPESLNDLFQEKQKRLESERKQVQDVIANLKTREPAKDSISNYKYYEGLPAIKSMWQEINNTITRDTTERIYGVRKGSFERLLGFYDEHHKLRLSKNAKAKIVLSTQDIALGKTRRNKLTQVRTAHLSNNAEWGVINDMVYLQHIVTKTPRAFLIQDPIFTETFKQVFDQVWTIARRTGK